MASRMIICSGAAVDIPKRCSYATFKEAALKAGRFSVWEACERPSLFDQLCHDPEIATVPLRFPWTKVARVRAAPKQGNAP